MSKCLWPEVTIPSVPEEETSGQVSLPGAKCVLSPAGGSPHQFRSSPSTERGASLNLGLLIYSEESNLQH